MSAPIARADEPDDSAAWRPQFETRRADRAVQPLHDRAQPTWCRCIADNELAPIQAEIKRRLTSGAAVAYRGDHVPARNLDGQPFNVNTRGDDPHAYTRDASHLPAAEVRAAARDAVGQVDGVGDEKAGQIAEVIDRSDEREARLQLAKSDPTYQQAFIKRLMHPDLPNLLSDSESAAIVRAEQARAALDVANSGSVLVPTQLDPSFVLTNDGHGPSSLRQVARQVTVSSSSRNGVTSAGVTAAMFAALAENTDNTPSVAAVSADLERASAYVEWSMEIEQDQGALVRELQNAIADAKARLEAEMFTVGSGSSNQPEGIITALDGTASEDTTPATAETLALADLYDLMGDLPTRHVASPSLAWLMAHGTALSVRELTNALTSAQGTWNDVAAGRPPLLLGAPVLYSDQCFNYRDINVGATAANTGVALVGDWSRFVIVDHSAGMSVELQPMVVGANRRPVGARGLFAMWRFSCVCTDIDAFRMLSIPTTA